LFLQQQLLPPKPPNPPKPPKLLLIPQGDKPFTQLLPIGHEGAQPMLQRSFTLLQSAEINTPVNPAPESPPLVVNIVTVCPTYLRISSMIELLKLSMIIASLGFI
jgi:hypothetical protein